MNVLYWCSEGATNIIGVFESRADAKVAARKRTEFDPVWRWVGGPRHRETADLGTLRLSIVTATFYPKES